MPHVYMSMFVIYRISTDKRTNTGRMTKIVKNEIKIGELFLNDINETRKASSIKKKKIEIELELASSFEC